METTQVEIARVEAAISEVIARDLHEVGELHLVLLGGGAAEIALS